MSDPWDLNAIQRRQFREAHAAAKRRENATASGHSLVVNDAVNADERNDPEGYVYCARCLHPADALGDACPGPSQPNQETRS